MTDVQAPVYAPLGGTSVSGTGLTVDMMTNPPTIIPQLIRDFAAENEGYFIEKVLATPGTLVQGGVVVGTETFPTDNFLDPLQTIAPRAPGAESPDVAGLRRPPKTFRPESWAAKIEITDEARKWNLVEEVTNLFRKTGNSFADRIQTSGMAAIDAAISSWARTASTVSWSDAAAASGGVINVARNTLPAQTFGAVVNQFIADKTGVRPDTVILNQAEGLTLKLIYGDNLPAFLASFGIKNMYETPQQTAGKAKFVKAGQVGSILWDKVLGQEEGRGPVGTWKDIIALEVRPVFVLLNADSVLEVTGLAA